MSENSIKNKGNKYDEGKVRLELVPPKAIELVGKVLTFGAVKYGDYNWCNGINYSRLYGAALRHLLAFWSGEDIDKESGLPHLAHAATNLFMLMCTKSDFDDRYKND